MRKLPYAVALVAAGMFAQPASAQLGGLVRKAKGAVEKKAESALPNSDVKPVDAFGAPLTAQSLDAVLRGLAASQAKIDEAKQAQAEADRYNKLMTQASAGHENERMKYQESASSIESCQSHFIEARRDSATHAFQRKVMNDPAAQAEAAKAATDMNLEYAKLLQKGDTAGAKRVLTQRASKFIGDPKADTAAAVKKCGTVPAKPAWIADEDKYRAQWQAAQDKARKIEQDARDAGVSASGMSKQDYGLARERIVNWLQEKNGGKQVQRFTDEERKAMDARNSDIQKYQSQLRG